VLYAFQPGNPDPGTKRLLAGQGVNDRVNDVYYLGNLPAGCLQRCQCVLLVGCGSGLDAPNGNLLDAFTALGAGCVIGSLHDPTNAAQAHVFADAFWLHAMRENKTAGQAFAGALQDSGMGLDDWCIDGDSNALRPARYK
jgi:hypothetical protein